jgi:hypothetical protein
MVKRLRAGAQSINRVVRRVLSRGDRPTLALFLGIGLLIYGFLFLTVHNRNPALAANQRSVWVRYQTTITTWLEEGPFKYGEFRLAVPFEKKWTDSWGSMDETKPYLYRSYPMGYLRPAYLVQLLHHALRGGYSQTLMLLHNQALVWLSSALLGFLVFQVARDLQIAAYPSILLGIACQSVYQTFPYNLQFYWEIYYTTTMSVVVVWFLILFYRFLGRDTQDRRNSLALGSTVFLMFYMDYVAATFLAASLLLVLSLLDRPALLRLRFPATVLLPAALFFGLFLGERYLLGVIYPDLPAVGSSFLARTGLDGSVVYVQDHAALFNGPVRGLLGRWLFLFFGGSLSIGTLVLVSLKRPALRRPVIVLAVALGAYLPKAFALVQETSIHPYAYDVYLVIPMIMALLGFLPAWLEQRFDRPGVFVLVAVAIAFCYCLVQLRLYAIQNPIPAEARWIHLS